MSTVDPPPTDATPPGPASWDEDRTAWWLTIAERRELQLAPVSDALFTALHLQPGERVLDVGCGPGSTTRRAHEQVGPDGRVTGTDISVGMIGAARQAAAGLDLEWIVGDAQTTDFGAGRFDVVMSRFGVMFFDDAAAAFANLSRACAPEGRLGMAIWKQLPEAPIFAIPTQVIARVLADAGETMPDPSGGPGPTTLGHRDATAALLHDAGWRDLLFTDPDVPLSLEGGAAPEEAADLTMAGGPAGSLLQGRSPEVMAAARIALVAAYEQLWDGTGIVVRGGFWIITGRPAR
ncbi:MAG: class I SAM-dependent methyltransferase [Propionibacteriaceae bacterium]